MLDTQEFIKFAIQSGLARQRIRGLCHILVGKQILKQDGSVISTGISWRELAFHLAQMKIDIAHIDYLQLDAEIKKTRDKVRAWYSAIAAMNLAGADARREAEELVALLAAEGFTIG